MNIFRKLYDAWKNSRYRQYELHLAGANADLRDAVIQFRVLERAIDGLNAMIAELTAKNAALEERNAELFEQCQRQAHHIAQLELALGDPEHIAKLKGEMQSA